MSASDTESKDDVCLICKEEVDDDDNRNISKLSQKGDDTINESNRKRYQEDIVARAGQGVYKLCRNTWKNTKNNKHALN